MLCDAASKEFSRDIEPMEGGYEDAFYLQLIRNIRKYKGVDGLIPQTASVPEIWEDTSLWEHISWRVYETPNSGAPRSSYGVSKNWYLSFENELMNDLDTLYPCLLIGSGSPTRQGWEGYTHIIKLNEKAEMDVFQLIEGGSQNPVPVAPAGMRLEGRDIYIRVPRVSLCEENRIFFKATCGIRNFTSIMDTYIMGQSIPMGRLSYEYMLG